jgi:hypothetical protein
MDDEGFTRKVQYLTAVREEGRATLNKLWAKSADAKHELGLINPCILNLPFEVTAEIFNWNIFTGGKMATILPMCTR